MQGVDRPRRVGEMIKRELAAILRRELQETSTGIVSVTGVDVSRDLRYATAYISALGGAKSQGTLIDLLSEQAPSIRYALGQSLNLRFTPNIRFCYDRTIEEGVRLSRLISDANAHRVKDDIEDGA